MVGTSKRLGWRAALALGCLVAGAPETASAGTITATIGPVNSFAAGALGTFSFTVPASEEIVSASVTLNNFSVAFADTAGFSLDNITLGTADEGNGLTSTFALSDISVLADGSATLAWFEANFVAGCPCVIINGNAVLSITTAEVATPEPASLALLGGAIAGLAGVRRRRSRGPAAGIG